MPERRNLTLLSVVIAGERGLGIQLIEYFLRKNGWLHIVGIEVQKGPSGTRFFVCCSVDNDWRFNWKHGRQFNTSLLLRWCRLHIVREFLPIRGKFLASGLLHYIWLFYYRLNLFCGSLTGNIAVTFIYKADVCWGSFLRGF
jgi:hypothetical protein